MRVVNQNSPGDVDNRGYVVSHVGLNVDRWWDELRELDQGDQEFFEGLVNSELEFMVPIDSSVGEPKAPPRRRFRQPMEVIEETIAHYVHERFLPEEASAVIADVINAITMRGLDLEGLGISRVELEQRIMNQVVGSRGNVLEQAVQPQKARQVARQRLDERIRSASRELLADLKMSPVGIDLARLFPGTGTTNNITAAIVLLNLEAQEYLGAGPKERDLLTTDQLKDAHDNIDKLIDSVATKVRAKRGR